MNISQQKLSIIREFHEQNFHDPIGYCRAVLGVELWWKQARVMEALRDHELVAVASSNAVGKSFLASCCVPWYLQTRPSGYVVTTGASWKGLSKILWPEIHKRVTTAPGGELNRFGELLDLEWKIAPQYGAFAVSPREPENFAGFRTPFGVLVIVDEASAMDYPMMEAILGLCSGAGSKVLMIGNPLRAEGPFYDAFRNPAWHCMHISAFESPNVAWKEEIVPGLATRSWVEARRRDWGEGSPAWDARVLGQFPRDGEGTLIALFLAEQAASSDVEPDANDPIDIGVDVARFGEDATVIQPVQGMVALEPLIMRKRDTMETVGEVVRAIRAMDPRRVHIDDIGVGGGVTDRLRELGYGDIVTGVNVASNANDEERFANLRAEGWWTLREWLQNGGRIPDNRALIGSITAPRYKIDSGGRIKLEPKEETKKRLLRSPDEGDALMLALLKPKNEVEIW